MRNAIPSSLSSLMSALFLVVVLMLAGCTADSLTGPVLGPETTVQSDGNDAHNNKDGNDAHNNKDGNDAHNNKDGNDAHN